MDFVRVSQDLTRSGRFSMINLVKNVAFIPLDDSGCKCSLCEIKALLRKCCVFASMFGHTSLLGNGYLIYWFPDPSHTNFTGSGGR